MEEKECFGGSFRRGAMKIMLLSSASWEDWAISRAGCTSTWTIGPRPVGLSPTMTLTKRNFRKPLHYALECEMARFLSYYAKCTELDEKRRVADDCRLNH